jgi:hypothetical protein
MRSFQGGHWNMLSAGLQESHTLCVFITVIQYHSDLNEGMHIRIWKFPTVSVPV